MTSPRVLLRSGLRHSHSERRTLVTRQAATAMARAGRSRPCPSVRETTFAASLPWNAMTAGVYRSIFSMNPAMSYLSPSPRSLEAAIFFARSVRPMPCS